MSLSVIASGNLSGVPRAVVSGSPKLLNLRLAIRRDRSYAGGYPRGERRVLREALALRRKALGDEHPDVGQSLSNLGDFLARKGEYTEAEPLLREALAIRLAKLDQQSAEVAGARLYLGSCLVKLRRLGEAEPVLLASYPVLKQKRGEDHEITRSARSALAELYRAWGRPKEALAYSR